MFLFLKTATLAYSILTLMLFVVYGFWWTMSILALASLVSFIVFIAPVGHGAVVLYLKFLFVVYLIVYFTIDYWAFEDIDFYKHMVVIYLPVGFVLMGDLIGSIID